MQDIVHFIVRYSYLTVLYLTGELLAAITLFRTALRYSLGRPKKTAWLLWLDRRYAMRAKGVADKYQLPTIARIGMGLTGAHHLFGSQQICELCIDEPELIEEYLAWEHKVNMRCIEHAVEFGSHTAMRNGFYETCDFYSPAFIRTMLFDRLSEEVEALHAHDIPALYTVHTGIMPMLE